MKRGEGGAVLVVMVFLAQMIVLGSLLLIQHMRVYNHLEKRQTVLDAAMLSVLRIRVQALETIVERWEALGLKNRPVVLPGVVSVPKINWPTLEKDLTSLSKAIPGYKGRITSVFKVVLDANNRSAENIKVSLKDAIPLSVVSVPGIVEDVTGERKTLSALWYRREWETLLDARYEYATGTVQPSAVGHVLSDAVNNQNEGYPFNWAGAVNAGLFDPHRTALYRAALKP